MEELHLTKQQRNEDIGKIDQVSEGYIYIYIGSAGVYSETSDKGHYNLSTKDNLKVPFSYKITFEGKRTTSLQRTKGWVHF